MDSWPEVDLSAVRRAFKGKYEVYEAIAYWVSRDWRVRGQGHKYGLYPPDPGFRMTPPFVRVDGTPGGDAKWQARTVHRKCLAMEATIREASS